MERAKLESVCVPFVPIADTGICIFGELNFNSRNLKIVSRSSNRLIEVSSPAACSEDYMELTPFPIDLQVWFALLVSRFS